MARTKSSYSDAAIAAMAAAVGLNTAGLTAVTQADVAGTVPAGGTGAAAGGWDTSGHRDTAITSMSEAITVINSALAALHTMGLPITIT